MDYKNIYRELDSNLRPHNRYMANKLIVTVTSFLKSNDNELKQYAKENLEEISKLREPYDLRSGEPSYDNDFREIARFTNEILEILEYKI